MSDEVKKRREILENSYKNLLFATSNMYHYSGDNALAQQRRVEFDEAIKHFKRTERNLEEAEKRQHRKKEEQKANDVRDDRELKNLKIKAEL